MSPSLRLRPAPAAPVSILALVLALAPGAAGAAGKQGTAPPAKGAQGAEKKAAPPSPAQEAESPELERLKALAGEWQGTATPHGGAEAMTTKASIRVVSAGSAVMLVTDPGTEHEMVTMFHRDDGALLATHYCAAMNQPRLKARAGGDPGRIAFEFMDGTNLKTHPGHMKSVVVTLKDADHHEQEWTFDGGPASHTVVFQLERRKP